MNNAELVNVITIHRVKKSKLNSKPNSFNSDNFCFKTLLALENGKHVLTEARMASNSTEARTMLEASRENPDLVCQIVPAPFTISIDKKINELLLNGYVGDIVSVELTSNPFAFVNRDQTFQWRHDIKYSGNNSIPIYLSTHKILY